MEHTSPFQLAKDLGSQLNRLISSIDTDSLPRPEQQILLSLKRLAIDVRLDMRDYSTAQTAAEQHQWAKALTERLQQLDQQVLQAGGLGLLGAADTAQLSALIQQLMSYV